MMAKTAAALLRIFKNISDGTPPSILVKSLPSCLTTFLEYKDSICRMAGSNTRVFRFHGTFALHPLWIHDH